MPNRVTQRISGDILQHQLQLAKNATPGEWYDAGNGIIAAKRGARTPNPVAQVDNEKDAAHIIANSPNVVITIINEMLRLREENERLAGVLEVQLQEAAVKILNGAIRKLTEGDGNVFSLGMTCPHCDMHFSTVEEAVVHDAACQKHPASIRAERLEKEADWLAMVLANASLGRPLSEYIEEDVNGMFPPAPEHWRDAARKAVQL